MPVLKPSLAVQPQTFSLRDVERQAAAILSRAQQQASALLEQAQLEAEQLRHAAQADGRAAGLVEGQRIGREQGAAEARRQALAEHKARLEALLGSLSAAALQIEQSRHELLHSAAQDVVRLSLAIARKVVQQVASHRPETVLETVNQALRFVIGRSDVRIVVHSSQLSLLQESAAGLQAQWPSLQHVQITADDSVAPGGARICYAGGAVDATLDGMLDRIAQELIQPEGAA